MSLKAVSEMGPVLVVCLPELGTKACRKLLAHIAERRRSIEEKGARIVLVHAATDEEAAAALEPVDLKYVMRISDPDRELYGHFDLPRVRRGLPRREKQLAGAFLLLGGEVIHRSRSSRPGELPDLG